MKNITKFMAQACPKFSVPNRKKIVEKKVISLFSENIGKISLTVGGWISINNEPFLGITVCFIDMDWKYRSLILDIAFFPHPHTGESIAQKIFEVCRKYNIVNKIISLTSDKARNILAAGKFLYDSFKKEFGSTAFFHNRCFAHSVQLVANIGISED